ncbi:hypothetical protein RD792_015640 [Penstemon davidsonii]|uniref:Xyloglucan endotransglucosylase/hydrolase n=1 Tax=Penstemon davidsonii TaxID=160366 RepID=A0ABR0CJ05_9LAMI|nr:hypothetical protein RD792_015640 [Penstemon davidsonii]
MNKVQYYSLFVSLFFHVAVCTAGLNLQSIPFTKGFRPLFGEPNIIPSADDQSVQLHLNQYTGNHGFFSAKIKLPSDYSAGIVVAFYTTNGDIFRKSHDELDFEFLGNIRGKAWRFYIDDVPIREIVRNDAMGGDFPSKPMSLYATIWDASDWATSGGRYKANYKYAPFVTEFTDLVLHGCASDPLQEVIATGCAERDAQLASIRTSTPRQKMAMKRFRSKYMYYSYCYDTLRYPVPPPECVIDPALRQRFKDTGRPKFDHKHQHRRFKKRGQIMGNNSNYGNQDDV